MFPTCLGPFVRSIRNHAGVQDASETVSSNNTLHLSDLAQDSPRLCLVHRLAEKFLRLTF